MNKLNRRNFLSVASTAFAFSIIPRYVLGGKDFVPPSDKINIGLIGVGTQQLGELLSLIPDSRVQITSVCDPNKNPYGYYQWSQGNRLKTRIRELIGESSWGGNINVPAGRDSGQDFINKYYARVRNFGKYNGCGAYSDFREMLEKEVDIDAVKIIVPDHAYPMLIITSLNKNKHVIMHKPLGNRVYETRTVINAAREKPELSTHMLAWSAIHERYETVKKWINEGVIGTLKEIHNWSYRPVWQQWQSSFTDRPEIPNGFDWDLWLGAWPDRPYHPNYTHTVYRGWYDFGAGSVADMGIYSLWPLFTTFGIDTPPIAVETMGTVTTIAGENNEMKVVPNNVAFPLSSILRWKFNSTKEFGSFDLFWYDGGMRPHNPPELEADNKELEREGMMFIGDKGKILGGFRCENPVIIPESKMIEITGNKTSPQIQSQRVDSTSAWIEAILNGKQSPGSILSSGPVIETAHLAAVALRTGRKILYSPENMKVTNIPEANKFLYRSEYRAGWEI